MRKHTPGIVLSEILSKERPDAIAWIHGNEAHSQLGGAVKFYDTPYDGILIEAEIYGLPNERIFQDTSYYAMHIHEKGDCSDQFGQTGNHYSKMPRPHPKHSGDMLPLVGNQGFAWSAFFDRRITIDEIEGRSVIIHAKPDDFTSQPSGNAGEKIACGVIQRK